MRRIFLALLLFTGGCASPGYFHEESTGLRVDANPQLLARHQKARLQCDAEAAKEALNSREPDIFTHNKLVQVIFEACMARAGYVVRGRG